MSERHFRFIMGISLWAVLIYSAYYEAMIPIYAFAGFLTFEAITNLRLTILLNRLRYGRHAEEIEPRNPNLKWFNKIDSERVLRIIIASLVIISFYVVPEAIWFIPWFIASMLILAGITNICPMVMLLRWTGLR